MLVPDRRTLIVLASLVGSMTVTSGLLLILEPGPATTVNPISLSSVESASGGVGQALLQTVRRARPGRWSAIVIRYGTLPQTTRLAAMTPGRTPPASGTAYHFVVRAGQGSRRDHIEVGSRWSDQEDGAYWVGPESDWVNRHAVGIAVQSPVGDDGPTEAQLRRLVWLVQQLQTVFKIPADRVILQVDSEPVSSGGRWFPMAWFRQQLLTFVTP